jgi:hypothetical protein
VVMVMVVVVGPKGGGMMMGGVKNVFTDSLRPSRSRSWVRDDARCVVIARCVRAEMIDNIDA